MMHVLEKYFCLFLLTIVPVLYLPITHNPVLIKSIVIAITACIWLILKIGGKENFSFRTFDISEVLLGLWLLINFLSLGTVHSEYINYLYLGEMIVMAAVYYLFKSACRELSLMQILRIVNISGLFVMLWGGLQFFQGRYKPISTFGNPNYFGAFLVSIWPLILLYLKEGRAWDKLTSLINTALFCFMTCYIRSLGMILSVILSVYLLIWLYCKNIQKKLILLFFAALVPCFILQIPAVHEKLLHHISVDIRPSIWQGVGKMIQTHPLLGFGAGRFQIFYPQYRIPEYFTHPLSVDNTDHAHCEPLEVLAETGMIGFACISGFLILTFMQIFGNFKNLNEKQQYFAGSLMIGISLLLFENLFDVNLRYAASKFILWSFLGLAAGLSFRNPSAKDQPREPLYFRLAAISGVMMVFLYFCFMRPFLGDVFFKQGIRARNVNNYASAVEYYRQACNIDPYHIEARYRLAFLYGSSGYVERGIEEYLEVLKMAPFFASTHNNLAILYSKSENLKQSEYHYRIQLQLNPYNAETLCGLASILLRQNRKDEAVLLLRKAVIIKPDHEFAISILKDIKSAVSQ